jgi:mannose-1-phosphate guanylyltransferase
MAQLHAVIMAGGSGTRFWPASRRKRPKQFLPLHHGEPLLHAAVARLSGLVDPDRIWIVTNRTQARGLARVLPDFPKGHVIVEPEPRDTAPCIALASATIAAADPDGIQIVLPADHLIEPIDAFQRMLQRGIDLCADGGTLVTFGIPPDHPATGYGYIETGTPLDDRTPPAMRVPRFREKPDRATAEQYLAAGNFLWNSGIFVWRTRSIRDAMAATSPELARSCDDMLAAIRSEDPRHRQRRLNAAFRRAPKTSIDYAVMERAPDVAVVRADLRWSDVGSFPALAAVFPADAHGNVAALSGGAAQIALESRGNVTYAEGRQTIALFGVHDLVVVAVKDAVMVCPKDRAVELKALVEQVVRQDRNDLL